ncbi:hypothetical protein PoB_005061300 [Plakobranchus ocellatus]|uniref:Uncharacterized protein n=1 Tax=Plakobranchus ocellatus TaxID=259542 RepID=A0AAV4BY04_9GAST|nr:hypothetical protein PoB_005061300 [Plakobranchus ocellatus]
MGKTTDGPEQQLFSKLYGRLLRHLGNGRTTDKTADGPTLDSLPLPARWGRKKRTIIEPPKMVSSDEFRVFNETIEKKKKR